MKIIWLNDIHLNFLAGQQVYDFLDKLCAAKPDAVLVGGDIGEAPDFAVYLQEMAEAVQRPIYFVLGNHDFYCGSIAAVHSKAQLLCEKIVNLQWLSRGGVFKLTDQVALIDHDGWGDYLNTRIELNDFHLISEFRGLDRPARLWSG